jgi:hypothetical protein
MSIIAFKIPKNRPFDLEKVLKDLREHLQEPDNGYKAEGHSLMQEEVSYKDDSTGEIMRAPRFLRTKRGRICLRVGDHPQENQEIVQYLKHQYGIPDALVIPVENDSDLGAMIADINAFERMAMTSNNQRCTS